MDIFEIASQVYDKLDYKDLKDEVKIKQALKELGYDENLSGEVKEEILQVLSEAKKRVKESKSKRLKESIEHPSKEVMEMIQNVAKTGDFSKLGSPVNRLKRLFIDPPGREKSPWQNVEEQAAGRKRPEWSDPEFEYLNIPHFQLSEEEIEKKRKEEKIYVKMVSEWKKEAVENLKRENRFIDASRKYSVLPYVVKGGQNNEFLGGVHIIYDKFSKEYFVFFDGYLDKNGEIIRRGYSLETSESQKMKESFGHNSENVDSYYATGKYSNGDNFHLDGDTDLENLKSQIEEYGDQLDQSSIQYWVRDFDGKETKLVESKIVMNNLDWGQTTKERNKNLAKYEALETEEEKEAFVKELKKKNERLEESTGTPLSKEDYRFVEIFGWDVGVYMEMLSDMEADGESLSIDEFGENEIIVALKDKENEMIANIASIITYLKMNPDMLRDKPLTNEAIKRFINEFSMHIEDIIK